MDQTDEQILTDSFFQGQVATNLMRLSLLARFNSYVGCLMLNKVAESMGQEAGDITKQAVLDSWYDTELNNAMLQVTEAQEAMREQGIIPLPEQQMSAPMLNVLKPIYAEMLGRLRLPEENPKADLPNG